MSAHAAPLPHRFTVADFHRLAEVEFFGEDERIELVEGRLIDMAPIGSGHASLVAYLTTLLARGIGDRAILYPQNPLQLGEDSEVYPDLTLLRPREDRYAKSNPTAADVFLVVEVAQSSLRHDRDTKLPLYARHGVPEAWLFDLDRRRATVYREPGSEGYRLAWQPPLGETLSPLALPEARVPLDDLWR